MTRKDKIQLQQSKLRGKLNSLLDVDAAERTDDQAGELAALMAEAQRLEVDFQSDSVLWPYIARNCARPLVPSSGTLFSPPRRPSPVRRRRVYSGSSSSAEPQGTGAAARPAGQHADSFAWRAACETPGAFGLAQSSILLVNTHSPWIADWMPALEDRRHAERWK